MTQDITITPFFITFDVIGGCIDIQTIYDHIKSVYKKEVFVLNANDYYDSSSRHSSSKSSESSHSRRSKSKNSSSNNSNSNTNNKESDENTGTIQSGRGSRQSHNTSSTSNSPSKSHDNCRSVVKGFKSRIESDLPKLIDNKRKFIAAQEKRRAQIEANKGTHKKPPSQKHLAEEKPKFDGIVDVIYIITNFPYLPKQLNALFEGGVPLDAFIAFKGTDFQLNKFELNDKIEKCEKIDIKPIEIIEPPTPDTASSISTALNSASAKSSRAIDPKKGPRKNVIPGSSLDYLNNPNSYPPVRWKVLQSESPISVSFVEITVGNDAESTFKLVIDKIISIQKSKSDFHEFADGRKYIHIPSLESVSSPSPPYQNQDLSHYSHFIEDNLESNQNIKSSRSRLSNYRSGLNSNNQNSMSSISSKYGKIFNPTVFVDALISQLEYGNWYPVPQKKPPGKVEEYIEMFKKKTQDVTRKVIVYPQRKQLEPVFEYMSDSPFSIDFKKALPSVYEYLYKLIKWKLSINNMYACKSWCEFLKNPDCFHAYSGQKFDLMFQRINKTYKFGLPLNFFEWKDWSLSIEHENVSEVLETAVEEADLVDTFLDEIAGLLFVLVMKPIPRNIGAFVPHSYMPLTMMVNSEWETNLIESTEKSVLINQNGTISTIIKENKEIEMNIKKSRIPITPSFITKSLQNGPINSNLFYQLLPSLSQRFENKEENVYKLPMYLTNSEEFTTPYFFEKSNMSVHVMRNCIHGRMTCNFKAFINSTFQIFSSENSISILPAENICFFFTFPFTFTIFFYHQSICYDTSKLILKASNEDPIVVTKNGDLTFMKDGSIPLILRTDGTIGQMLQKGKWTYVNKEGETYKPRFSKKKGKMVNSKVDLPHSSYYDASKGIKTMIRPDGIDYIISNKGKREIIFKNDITVVQDDTKKISYDIPSFPMIAYDKESSTLSLEIDKFKCFFKDNSTEIQCDEFFLLYKDGTIFIKYNSNNSCSKSSNINNNVLDCESFITKTTVEFKSGEKDVLFFSKDGTEKRGELLIPDENENSNKKKKIDYLDTHWGKLIPIKETYTEAQQMELHKIFFPRFFVIRSDLSATQYFRPDVINLEGYRPYKKTILHPSGDSVNIVTFHQEDQLPFLFIENKTLTKIDRVNLLKSVHIPKPPKKRAQKPKENNDESDENQGNQVNNQISDEVQKVLDEAHGSHHKMNENARRFQVLLTRVLAKSQDKYIDDIMPPPPPPKEVIRVPPQTPQPRLLEMQHNLYDLTSTGKYNVNYWKSNESEFGFPIDEPHKPETPLSPRTRLLDPPRLFKPEKKSNLNMNKITNSNSNLNRPITPLSNGSSKKVSPCISRPFSAGFATQKIPTTMICPDIIENKEILKPKAAQLNKTKIDLGTVFVGDSKTGEITVKNTTVKPLRFNCSQFKLPKEKSNILRILTIPGVIMPGLSISVKVMLEAKCVEDIDTFFEFRTPLFSSRIQITATVVKNPNIVRKKKKVMKLPDVVNDASDIEYVYEYEEEEEEAQSS